MNSTRVAIPTQTPGGLMSDRSEHFGHCDLFTLIDIADGNITRVQIVDNIAHGPGGCSRPVHLLQEKNVNTIVVAGMGTKPLSRFSEAGIEVLFAQKNQYSDVKSLVDGFIRKEFSAMKKKNACKGSGNCHHHGEAHT